MGDGKIGVGELVEAARRLDQKSIVLQPAQVDARHPYGVELIATIDDRTKSEPVN